MRYCGDVYNNYFTDSNGLSGPRLSTDGALMLQFSAAKFIIRLFLGHSYAEYYEYLRLLCKCCIILIYVVWRLLYLIGLNDLKGVHDDSFMYWIEFITVYRNTLDKLQNTGMKKSRY